MPCWFRGLWTVAVTLLLLVAFGCSGDDDDGDATAASSSATSEAQPVVDDAVVHGGARLDGQPFDSRWVGAVVLHDGLVTPCQRTLPPVTNGNYVLTVIAATESIGCGEAGARVVLWTYANDKRLFSTNTVAWPGEGASTSFAAEYSSAAPEGAVPTTAEFNGSVFDADGEPLGAGTNVEAYVDDTRCGVASVRSSDEFTGYVLAVVGPDAIPECTRGAPLVFKIDGQAARPTNAVNTPPGQQGALDLKVATGHGGTRPGATTWADGRTARVRWHQLRRA